MKKSQKILKSTIVCVPLVLCSCNGRHEIKYFSKELGIDFKSGKVVSYTDTHGGFLGDGYMKIELSFKNDAVKDQISKNSNFHPFPLSSGLHAFLYENFDSGLNIPFIENGYYYFCDRHSQSTDKYDDTELMDRYSFNFTFILYNIDARIAYICDYDT